MEKFIVGNTTFIFENGVIEDLNRNFDENVKLYEERTGNRGIHTEPVDAHIAATEIYNIFMPDDHEVRTIHIDPNFFDNYFRHFAVAEREWEEIPMLTPKFDFDAPQIDRFTEDFLS